MTDIAWSRLPKLGTTQGCRACGNPRRTTFDWSVRFVGHSVRNNHGYFVTGTFGCLEFSCSRCGAEVRERTVEEEAALAKANVGQAMDELDVLTSALLSD